MTNPICITTLKQTRFPNLRIRFHWTGPIPEEHHGRLLASLEHHSLVQESKKSLAFRLEGETLEAAQIIPLQ